MRMRPKKNRDIRLERVSGLLAAMDGERVDLLSSFGAERELFVELGCGKGAFVTGLSERYPSAALLAVEKVTDVAMMAMEKADRAGCKNVRFLIADGAAIDALLPAGCVTRLYLNFSDPWPKKRNAKRRLTSPLFLERYKTILASGGRIFFKTDNRPLFDYSLETFDSCGYGLENICFDLHNSPLAGMNIMTEYERTFSEKGFAINYLEAILK